MKTTFIVLIFLSPLIFGLDYMSGKNFKIIKLYLKIITVAVNECCNEENRNCCIDRIVNEGPFPCKSQENWEETIICLETKLHNVSLVESDSKINSKKAVY